MTNTTTPNGDMTEPSWISEKVAALRATTTRAGRRAGLRGITWGTLEDVGIACGVDPATMRAARTWREMDRLILAALEG